MSGDPKAGQTDFVNRLVRIVILVIVSFLISIAAVSFAVHHMRLQFEGEFKRISDTKVEQVCDIVKRTINGDDISSDSGAAAEKYATVFNLMLADTSTENMSQESYALYAYRDGQLSVLLYNGAASEKDFAVAGRSISEWLDGSFENTVVGGSNFESIIVPITDSTGMCVGVFEYKVTYDGLYEIGNTLESRILVAVIISVVAGVVMFIVQEIFVKIMRGKQGDKGRGESARARDKRITSTTIGYCFAIVLIVLLVMSSQLSSVYVKALESERADAMEKCALSSAIALSYTNIEENMSYGLPLYTYAAEKPYMVNIYTMAGDSFLRLYTSQQGGTTDQYYLSGVGDQYVNCFVQQQVAFTSRKEGNDSYVCAIAPIISSENTVAGVLEVAMPRDDFESTVNGMSLSWIFTIISIAISMGIIVFELNLFISTLSRGISGNAPVIVMYGENAVRFLSFFMAVGSIMIPITYADFYKQYLDYLPQPAIQAFIAASCLLFAFGFFGLSGIKQSIKSKLTSKIAIISITAFGYFLALVTGILANPYVAIVMTLPMGFCFGMPFSYMRDYRINAGRVGYKDFNDRNIHNIQAAATFMGVSVGTVIAGICYERFGLLIVAVISGAVLILSAFGMIYFIQNNNPVREAPLSISGWLQIATDRDAGKFLNSSFLILGMAVSFLLVFIPDYLEKVGISLATSSFYYLLCGFFACVVTGFVKNRYSNVLTSRVRVIIEGAAVLIGILIFALAPSAKILIISVALIGVALGIHDFYYIYVLYLICGKKYKANLRKCAEYSFYFGFGILIPVSMLSFMIGDVRIVFLIASLIIAVLAFIYPVSSISGKIDERDTSLKANKKAKRVDPATMAPNQNTSAVAVPGAPAQQAPAMPQEPVAVSADDFYANRPIQGPEQPMQQAQPAQPVPDPTAFLNSDVPGGYQQEGYAPEGDPNGNGGDYNG